MLVVAAGILLSLGRTSATAQIIIPPFCSSDADCDDGDPCTTDRCLLRCRHSNPCDDGNACTDDVCKPVLCPIFDPFCIRKKPYSCSNLADDSNACADGSKCNGVESCSSGTCVPGAPPCPDDGDNSCTDACNEATGSCDAPAVDDTPCNDQRACTATDVCRGGLCIGGDPVVCQRLDQCHAVGTCNDLNGQCTNPLLDGAFCSASGQPGICDAAGQCLPASSLCGTIAEQCNGGECCTPSCRLRTANETCGGNPPACRAPRHCNERDAFCPPDFPPAPDATPCDDGVFCNGVDACSAGACTVHSLRPAGVACPLVSGEGVCDGAGGCVPAVCGNGMVEPGEECDDEECCTDACRFKGPTEPCGEETRSCHEHPLCNGREATCPTVPRPSPEGSTCSDDNECTLEDTCQQGECTPGPAVCGVTAEVRKNGKRKVTVRVGCESDEPAECEASLVAVAPTTGTTIADSGPVLSEIAQARTAKTARLKKSTLGFRTVIHLRLNERGRALLKNDDLDARLVLVVRRAGGEFHPPASLLRLLKLRR